MTKVMLLERISRLLTSIAIENEVNKKLYGDPRISATYHVIIATLKERYLDYFVVNCLKDEDSLRLQISSFVDIVLKYSHCKLTSSINKYIVAQ